MPPSSSRSRRLAWWRRVVYWALWPVEQLALTVGAAGRALKFLVIASNPVFLAAWLAGRGRGRREDNERD